jgi:hypothetical protein
VAEVRCVSVQNKNPAGRRAGGVMEI